MKATLTLFLFVLIGTGSAIFSQTVTIGTQVWMTKNLNVATFRNGDPIPEAKTDEEWERAGKLKQPAWCYYNNESKNGKRYGKLYNYYAVSDPRGLAPKGWHLASSKEFESLCLNLGVNIKSETDTTQLALLNKLKSSSWGGKYENNQFSKFNLLPSSFRNSVGEFGNENNCNIEFNDGITFNISGTGQIYYEDEVVNDAGAYGYSVRCLRD